MTLASMTGFGRAQVENETTRVTVEMKSVNHRYLKINCRGPMLATELQQECDAILRKCVSRGAVNVSVVLERTEVGGTPLLNRALATAYKKEFEALGLPLEGVVRMPGVVEEQPDTMSKAMRDVIRRALEEAAAGLVQMRGQEGVALCGVLGGLLDELAAHKKSVEECVEEARAGYAKGIRERAEKILQELGGANGVDGDRLVQEVALIAERSDITEEIDRLESHITLFRQKLKSRQPVGRTLEFLTQEMLREVNTMGSKSNHAALSYRVVEMKGVVERLKEQVANIE